MKTLLIVSIVACVFATPTIHLTDKEPFQKSPRPIPANFIGFSMELNPGLIKRAFTSPQSTKKNIIINPVVVQLFKNLVDAVNGKGAPTLRLGGNNGMFSYWSESSNHKDPGPHNAGPRGLLPSRPIHRHCLQTLDKFATATGVKLIIAVPMRFRDPKYAYIFVKFGILRFIKKENLMAIELGNEPNHWKNDNWRLRNENYDVDEYIKDAKRIIHSLRNEKGIVFQAPATAGCSTNRADRCWDLSFPKISSALPRIKYLAYHRFGNSGCRGGVTERTLLDDPQTESGIRQTYDWIDAVRPKIEKVGHELVFGEGNSASCVGLGADLRATLSYAATLWALDNLFEPAVRGVTRSSLHGIPSAPYAPIFADKDRKKIQVRPVYYAMLIFNELLEGGNSIVFRPNLDSFKGDVDLIKIWGVRNKSNGIVHLVVIHKNLDKGDVKFSVETKGEFKKKVRVRKLKAPAINSKKGIKFDGRTFDETDDGTWTGKEKNIYEEMDGNSLNIQADKLAATVYTFEPKGY